MGIVSFGLHPFHRRVETIKWYKYVEFPQLHVLKLGGYAFNEVQSVMIEGEKTDGLIIQICLNCNPLNSIDALFGVILQ